MSEVKKVFLHYRVCTLDATNWDEEMCRGVVLAPRPEAYIEAKTEREEKSPEA